jgi:cell fate regulator YaaT (PSP1 superfamily)
MWLVTARYGAEQLIGNFKGNVAGLKIGDKCVIKTDRGTEIGTVISQPELMPPPQDVQRKPEPPPANPQGPIGASPNPVGPAPAPVQTPAPPPDQEKMGDVLRRLATQDYEELKRIEKEKAPAAFKFCAEKAKSLNLPINIVFVEYLLGGEKIVFYFMAEGRIDFRELVKELAKEYKTRIEMRQIGVRDEARLLGDVGHCGHQLCCKTCVKELEPVTMKMAKTQKTTLDPTKISGYCGRLMCCLRFEDEFYNELKHQLPKKGAVVKTSKGTGEVINIDLLSQSLTIEVGGGERIRVWSNEIQEIIKEPTLKVPENEKNNTGGQNNK